MARAVETDKSGRPDAPLEPGQAVFGQSQGSGQLCRRLWLPSNSSGASPADQVSLSRGSSQSQTPRPAAVMVACLPPTRGHSRFAVGGSLCCHVQGRMEVHTMFSDNKRIQDRMIFFKDLFFWLLRLITSYLRLDHPTGGP